MPADILEQLRTEQPLSGPELETLRQYARSVVQKPGWVPQAAQEAFHRAGHTSRHLLDVPTVVALKTLSNYTNHVAETPLDNQFAAEAWSE